MNGTGLAMTLMPPTIAVSICPLRKACGGVMKRDQRGRAGGIERDARAVQVENIGDAVAEDGERVSGRKMRIRDRHVADDRMRVIGLRGADEYADFGPGDRGRPDAGVFKRLPGQLQQDPLLRIHLLRLARGDAEHARVKTPDVVDNAGGEGIALAALLASRMAESLQRKAVGRHLRDGATPLEQQATRDRKWNWHRETGRTSRRWRYRHAGNRQHPQTPHLNKRKIPYLTSTGQQFFRFNPPA